MVKIILSLSTADRRPRFQRGNPRGGPRRPRQPPPGQDSQGEERGPSDGGWTTLLYPTFSLPLASAEGEEDSPQQVERRRPRGGFRGPYRNNDKGQGYRAPYGRGYRGGPRRREGGPPASQGAGVCCC